MESENKCRSSIPKKSRTIFSFVGDEEEEEEEEEEEGKEEEEE